MTLCYRWIAVEKSLFPQSRGFFVTKLPLVDEGLRMPAEHIYHLVLEQDGEAFIPTIFTSYLVIPPREQFEEFVTRIRVFYDTHSDDEIAAINSHTEHVWHQESYPSAKDIQPKPHKKRAGYVYLLKSEVGHYKIGCTNNPQNRLKTFGVKLPFRVEFVCLIKTDDMEIKETELHDRFQSNRLDGEWFNLSPDNVQFIKTMAEQS